MEYVPGGTLQQRLASGFLQVREAAKLVGILAQAVHAAHRENIVHRDLKPTNILMALPVEGNEGTVAGGFPKVSDFGLARLADRDVADTMTGAVVGAPPYMAPELAAGRPGEVGKAADVYALGAILYQCLSGRLPFQGDDVQELLVRVQTDSVTPLRELCPDVPAALEDVCLGCLEKSPEDRPSARELERALKCYLAGGTPKLPPKPADRRRQRRALLLVSGLLVVAVLTSLWGLGARKAVTPLRKPAVKLRVLHWERDQGADVPAGAIRPGSEVLFDDRVVIQVELSHSGYCYLIAFNCNGKEQLLWPCDEARWPHPGDPKRLPPQRDRLRYPPPPLPRQDGKQGKATGFRLNDHEDGGMQAFVVVASRRPLPPYDEWKRQRGLSPWQHQPAARGVWCSDGATMDQVDAGGVRFRGEPVELVGQPPLLRLCDWACGADVVEAMAFPVFRREGK